MTTTTDPATEDGALTDEGAQEMAPRPVAGGRRGAARDGQRAAPLRGRRGRHGRRRARPGRGHHHHHEHGAPAPLHPRRAPPHARARRRAGAADQAGHRVPAHRHGEDRRAAHLPPGPDQRDPHGLRGPAVQRAGLLAHHREAARRRDPRAGHLDPDAALRAQPGQLQPAVHRHQRHGPRRGVDDALRLAGARGGPAGPRGHHRPADEPQLHPPRAAWPPTSPTGGRRWWPA